MWENYNARYYGVSRTTVLLNFRSSKYNNKTTDYIFLRVNVQPPVFGIIFFENHLNSVLNIKRKSIFKSSSVYTPL